MLTWSWEPHQLLADRSTVNWIWTFLKKIIEGKGTKECGWDTFSRATFSFFLPGDSRNSWELRVRQMNHLYFCLGSNGEKGIIHIYVNETGIVFSFFKVINSFNLYLFIWLYTWSKTIGLWTRLKLLSHDDIFWCSFSQCILKLSAQSLRTRSGVY